MPRQNLRCSFSLDLSVRKEKIAFNQVKNVHQVYMKYLKNGYVNNNRERDREREREREKAL